MPDDDVPAPASGPELRPATRRRPRPKQAAPEPSGGQSDERAEVEAAALAGAAAPEANPVGPEVDALTAQEEDAVVSSLDVGAAAAEVSTPPVPAPEAGPAGDPLLAAAAGTPAKRAAAKKAPAKAPAKAAAKAPGTKAPAKKAPATKAPANRAPELGPDVAVAVAGAAVAGAELSAASLPPAAPLPPAPPVVPAGLPPARDVLGRPGLPAGFRAMLVLIVLLLAAAAGMAAAALVERGPETWRSTVTVRLVPGAGTPNPGTTVTTARDRYAADAPQLTADAASTSGIPGSDLRADVAGERLGADQVRLVARAAKPWEARTLASAAAQALLARVDSDQAAAVPDAAQRVTGLLSGYVTVPERTRPSDRLALGVGLAVGVAVLLLGRVLSLVSRGRRD